MADRPMVIILIFAEERHDFGARGDFPDFYIFILSGPGQHQTIRGKGEAGDRVIILGKKKPCRFPRMRVPESDGSVVTAGCEYLAVGAEGDLPYIVGVPFQGFEKTTGFNFPDAKETIRASADERQSVSGIRHVPDAVRMSPKGPDFLYACFPIFQGIDGRQFRFRFFP